MGTSSDTSAAPTISAQSSAQPSTDRAIEYLELIVRGARTIEFEGPILTARRDRVPASVLNKLEHARGLALQAHRTQLEQTRRERELSALYETAGDLAALKDVDDVLEAIAIRVRILVGSDVSYLSLNDDERGGTYMRVTNGIVSQEFKDCRMEFGDGLGGLVAQTATPYWTDDYFNDARFQHTSSIDTQVEMERLTAILGVPLQLGRRVIGVLFAANRTPRAFSRRDVNLLVSLAAHAAVAIDSARLLSETRAALEDLKSASTLLELHAANIERASDAHDRLAAIVVRGGSVADVVHETRQVIDRDIAVLDSAGKVLAATQPHEEIDEPFRATARRGIRENRTIFEDGLFAVPVQGGMSSSDCLLMCCDEEPDDTTRRILERAATVTALLLVVRRSVAETESRLRGDLLADVISSHGSGEAFRERAQLLGADLDDPHAVVVVDAASDRSRVAMAMAHLAFRERGLSAVVNQHVVVVLPGHDPESAGAKVFQHLRAGGHDVTVGAAGPATSPETVPTAYGEALRCVDALIALGRRGEVASARGLGFVGLLLGGNGDVGEFVRGQLSPVREYDDRRGTSLIRTLEEYFVHGQHLTHTAAALHVHPNTVIQRLERVTHLLDRDWQQPGPLLEIQLALRLCRLQEPEEKP